MTLMKFSCVALLTAVVTSCGGGGSTGGGSTSVTAYNYVAPPVNSTRIYNKTIIDNSANTINIAISDTTTTVNPDGSSVVLVDNPNNNTVTVNGTTYVVPHTETDNVNKSGQTVSTSNTPTGGATTTCTFSPNNGSADYPLVIGQAWSITDTETCVSSAPTTTTTYTHTGSVIDVESVTVPAGTYSAVKLQTTGTWTNSSGTAIQTLTNWRDASTGISVKQVATISYSGIAPYGYTGIVPNGYPVSFTMELQSYVP